MSHRRFYGYLTLAGAIVACSPGNETGADPSGLAGGNGPGGSSTGMALGGESTGGRHNVGGAVSVNEGGTATTGGTNTSTTNEGGAGKNASTIGGSTSRGGASSTIAGSTSRGGASSTIAGSTSRGGNGAGGASGGGSAGGNGTAGSAGANGVGSKRGIAANIAPGAAFYPAVRWWYNWAVRSTGANVGIEFVPMIWDEATVSASIPNGSKYLLGFNEPNFFAQANLSPAQAASFWPTLQANARQAGVPIVGPAMNYCGPASECHGTDPYQYLKDFFAACATCQVDFIAVHWYNCDLPSLRDYLEPGGNLPGFEQFGKPLWLTEFSCDGNASVAQQEAFMRVAIPYLESNPKVARYSWFSADPIPNARLVNPDGSPTALGRVYISLPHE